MHKIYILIVGQTNEKLQEKAASDATFQAVKTDRDPIVYLMIHLLLKPIQKTPNPLIVSFYEVPA